MSKLIPTDAGQFLNDLNGGVFAKQVATVISDVAESVAATGKAGKITLTFDVKTIGEKELGQIQVAHDVKYSAPHEHGVRSDNHKRTTSMHVNDGGKVSLFASPTLDFFGAENKEPAA